MKLPLPSTLAVLSLLLTLTAGTAHAEPKKLPVIPQGNHPSGHRYLADPVQTLKPHYKYVVVGSGYGGSVIALRIAEHIVKAGLAGSEEIAIFERGKEWLPGDFPSDIADLAQSLRSESNPLGLVASYTDTDADMDVIGANGLGGTSLLNAAITLRPPANVFALEAWPAEVRADFAQGKLSPYFDEAEAMLRPNLGPGTRDLPKSKSHLDLFPENFPKGELTLNVNHEEGHSNCGVVQHACTNCGNCCGGCNVGSKNTLTTTYLPAAKSLGAHIYSQMEAKSLQKLDVPLNASNGPRWRVNFLSHSDEDGPSKVQVTADNVFVAAGSAGSTELLMNSASETLIFSPTLGSRVSANGDVLGFMYNGKAPTNIVAYEDTATLEAQDNPVGQTITVYADYREINKDRPIDEQFVLLDGAIPRSFAPALAKTLATTIGGVQSLTSFSAGQRVARDLFNGYPGGDGALNHSMLLLGCGHDSSGGVYVRDRDGQLHVEWPGMQDEASFRYINKQMEAYAKRAGGKFIPNPRSHVLGGGKMQATHPLGGVPMGDSAATGAVNHLGQVFDGKGGVHEGLFVVDAAIIPHSLAAPPLITITMLAERIADHFTQWTFDPCGAGLSNLWPLKSAAPKK